MPSKTIFLPSDIPIIAAAGYLALVAYPNDDEIFKRNEFIEAVKASVVKANKSEPEYMSFPEAYRKYKNEKIDGQFSKIAKRIYNRRIPALKIAYPLLLQAYQENKKSLNERIEAAMHLYGGRENTYKRIWMSAKPILHLLFGLMNSVESFSSIEELILESYWLQPALSNAEELRKWFTNKEISTGFDISESQSIQVLLR